MSRNPKPTSEELRFVYGLILKGDNESDILAEYASLYAKGTLMFPYRTDKRFIRERKKELASAEEVLKGYAKNKLDPIIIELRMQHYDKLAEIANSFLENDLGKVSYDASDIDCEYSFDNTSKKMKRNELIHGLEENIFQACDKYGRWLVMDCLVTHIEAEYSDKQNVLSFIRYKPVEFITIVRQLAESKAFKGTCPVCKDWGG